MKSTKKSLIMSMISLILCFAMLLGSTWAWFTDEVTSGKNTIKAGNLDVELYHGKTLPIEQTPENSVKDATELFGVALWEPGVVAYENFTVANVGNLALKYALNLNVFDKNATAEGHDLTEVIKVAVIENGFSGDRAAAQTLSFATLADFQKTGNLAAGNTTGNTFGVVLYWEPTDHDNDYNVNNYTGTRPTSDGQPLFVEFGVNLVATQDTVEADSFNNQYDKLAEFPVTAITKVETGKETTLKAYDGNNVLAAKAVIPAAAQGDGGALYGASKVEMTVDETDKPSGITLDTGEQTVSYDVKFFSVAENGTKTPITDFGSTIVNVDLSAQIPDGADLMKVYHTHNGVSTEMEKVTTSAADVTDGKFYYDVNTKILTVGSKTFSPFTFVYKTFVAKVKETDTKYGTLQEAVDAASEGNTVELLIDYTVPTTAPIQVNKALTLNLGGFELKGTSTNPVVYITGSGVTLTNGTITATAVASGWGAVSLNGGQIDNITSSITVNSNSRGLYVAAGTVKDLNCTIKANLAGNLAQTGSEAIYINTGTVEKISNGSYSSHPNSFVSDAYSQMASPVIYVNSTGTLGTINGGTFQGGATYCIQSYSEFNIAGGTFMYPYVDGNNYGKGNAYNPTNYFPNTKPTITGGKFYVGGKSTDSGLTETNKIMFTKLASGYQLVRAEEVEMFARTVGQEELHYYFWSVVHE